MDKNRLVRFMARVMEESGFKVYQNFQTSRHIIDIYGVLPTIVGDIGVVVACKNYDERWEVGMDVLKEMEMVAKTLKASKIVVVTTSYFTDSANNYAGRRNIKLIDKDGLMVLAKRFSQHQPEIVEEASVVDYDDVGEETEYTPSSSRGPSVSLGFLSRGKASLKKGTGRSSRPSKPLWPRLRPLIKNPIVLIIIVLILSKLITYLVELSSNSTALSGMSTIVSSAVLAYGLVLILERDLNATLVKGTTVFFVALLVNVLLILFF
ncbi:MAG: restriction endonuclease [Methanobacteriaceae archaeon]